jgi:hypothetical protein
MGRHVPARTAAREASMNFDYSEADEYEADFIASGAIEFDELEDELPQIELAALAGQAHTPSWN